MIQQSNIITAGLSTEKILLTVCEDACRCLADSTKPISHLDIGAGNGALIKFI